jgi:class 3 adenylate cyclase
VSGEPDAPVGPRWRVPVATLLALGFGALMFVAVGSVLLLSLAGARENNRSLLRDRAEVMAAIAIGRVRAQLDPVQAQAEYMARLVEDRQVDPNDEGEFVRVMFGALAATPQVHAIAFVRPDLSTLRVERDSGAAIREDWSDRPDMVRLMDGLRAQPVARWRGPTWSAELGHTLLTIVMPLTAAGRFVGVLMPVVTITEVSRYLAALASETGRTIFVLYDEELVIAHPGLANDPPAIGPLHPLPTVDEVGDPVLAQAFRAPRRPLTAVGELQHSRGHIIDLPDDFYVIIYRQEVLYGEQPWIIGTYAPGAEIGTEVRWVQAIAAIGGGMLVLAVGLTIWVGRRISRPILRLARAARQVEGLDFRAVDRLPPSRVREIDEAARAFNAMASGLAWFETYLPRTLVRQLLSRPDRGAVVSEERAITVMFTDISGSTALAGRMSGVELAEFLNHHFAIVGGGVDATGGTIDKYTGDGVMAFWGAPVTQPDHAWRACRAALDIARMIAIDNEARLHLGLPGVRMRVGIHTGIALVGNIGAPGRINYTPLGDTVIMAQRIQEIAKELDRGEAVTVLVSAATRAEIGDGFATEAAGTHELRGRDETTGLYRLIG